MTENRTKIQLVQFWNILPGDYYIGKWKLEGNTVVGTTTDPITERYKFTSINGKNAEIDYSNSEGEKIKFRATKTESTDDELVNSYFRYPAMDWGMSVNGVKSYMSGYSLSKETSTSLLYKGKMKENQTAYIFKEGKLSASAIEIGTSVISADALVSLLKEDFNYIKKQGNYYYFQSKDKKTNAVLTAENKGMLTYYVIAFDENK